MLENCKTVLRKISVAEPILLPLYHHNFGSNDLVFFSFYVDRIKPIFNVIVQNLDTIKINNNHQNFLYYTGNEYSIGMSLEFSACLLVQN